MPRHDLVWFSPELHLLETAICETLNLGSGMRYLGASVAASLRVACMRCTELNGSELLASSADLKRA